MVNQANTQTNYRFPGIRPFYDNDIDRRLFFGRDTEKEALLHKILADKLVVLYARSGLGKTSLLNAGLSQELRDRGFIPLMVRFNDPEIDPVQWIYAGIEEIVKQKSIEVEAGEKATLWQYFKTTYFWSGSNKMLTPVLILDQFEEFFTLYSPGVRKGFIRQLADVVNNKIPASLLESMRAEEPLPYNDNPPYVKIIISIREDYVGQLEEISRKIPDILHHRFRLLPLSREQARQAIIKPSQVQDEVIGAVSFTFAPKAVGMMLDFLCKRRERGIIKMTDEVESFQLQLLCRHIEDMVRDKTKKKSGEIIVKKKDLGGEAGMQRVMQRFYDDQVEQLGTEMEQEKIRRLCEEGLISITDRRLSLEEDEITRRFEVSKVLLQELVNRRLLRAEPRVGSVYYELSHDTLVNPIRESQKKRELQKQKLQRERELQRIRELVLNQKITLKRIKNIGFLLMFIIILIYTININRKFYQEKKEIALKYQRDGNSQFEERKYNEAIKKYQRAIENDPKLSDAYERMGDAQFRLKKYNDAINSYEQAISINPTYTTAKVKLAAVYFIRDHSIPFFLQANELLEENNIFIENKLIMRFVLICSFFLQGKQSDASAQLKDFIKDFKSLREDYKYQDEGIYRKCWGTLFKAYREFIDKNDKKLSTNQKELLLQLIDLLESPKKQRDKKLKELEIAIEEIFK